MWALKAFDGQLPGGEPQSAAELARTAEEWGAGLELALYAGEGFDEGQQKTIDEAVKSAASLGKGDACALHWFHKKVGLSQWIEQDQGGEAAIRLAAQAMPELGAEAWESGFEALRAGGCSATLARAAQEAAWGRRFGAKLAVLHVRAGDDPEWWKSQDPKEWGRRSEFVFRQARELGMVAALEKTMESQAWLEALMGEAIKAMGASNVGFVWDLGHTRVWQRAPLESWEPTLLRWRDQGVRLHFHLHANDGIADRHETFSMAQAMGWMDPSEDWAREGLQKRLEWVQKEFEGSAMLVLEHSMDRAAEALGWVELALRDGRRGSE